MNRREFLIGAGGTAVAVSVGAGAYFGANFGNSATASITIDNADTTHHTVAILVTDEEGNTDWFDGTVFVRSGETRTLDDAITFEYAPEAVARVLLDTGTYAEFPITIENNSDLRFKIEPDGTITHE